jgi:hypothetical protein
MLPSLGQDGNQMMSPPSFGYIWEFHFHFLYDLSELRARVHLLERKRECEIILEIQVTKKGTPVTKLIFSNSEIQRDELRQFFSPSSNSLLASE